MFLSFTRIFDSLPVSFYDYAVYVPTFPYDPTGYFRAGYGIKSLGLARHRNHISSSCIFFLSIGCLTSFTYGSIHILPSYFRSSSPIGWLIVFMSFLKFNYICCYSIIDIPRVLQDVSIVTPVSKTSALFKVSNASVISIVKFFWNGPLESFSE